MGLTNKKEEQLRKMPRIESYIFKSKDNKYIIQKTTISTVRPVGYYHKIMEGKEQSPTLEQFDDSDFFVQEGEELIES
jgi:hypothetical protein